RESPDRLQPIGTVPSRSSSLPWSLERHQGALVAMGRQVKFATRYGRGASSPKSCATGGVTRGGCEWSVTRVRATLKTLAVRRRSAVLESVVGQPSSLDDVKNA